MLLMQGKPIFFCMLLMATGLVAVPAHAQYTDSYTMPRDKMWGVFIDRACANYGESGCLKWASIPDCIPVRAYPNRCRMVVNHPAPESLSGQPTSSESPPRQPPSLPTIRNWFSNWFFKWSFIGVFVGAFFIGLLLRLFLSPYRHWKDYYDFDSPWRVDPMPHIPRIPGLHRHHIIPRHMGGSDDPDNIAYLTPKEHAEAHLALYREFGRKEDLWAYRKLMAKQDSL